MVTGTSPDILLEEPILDTLLTDILDQKPINCWELILMESVRDNFMFSYLLRSRWSSAILYYSTHKSSQTISFSLGQYWPTISDCKVGKFVQFSLQENLYMKDWLKNYWSTLIVNGKQTAWTIYKTKLNSFNFQETITKKAIKIDLIYFPWTITMISPSKD